MMIKKLAKKIIPTKLQQFLKKIINIPLYFGFRYQCPMCHFHLRRMQPMGFAFPVLVDLQVVGGGNVTMLSVLSVAVLIESGSFTSIWKM